MGMPNQLLVAYVPGVFAFVLGSILVYLYLVYPLLVSPIAKVPNAHWTSGFSPWWILWKRYRSQELQVVNEAHKKLGPIVRLGPKDLSVSCYENGIRTIYGGGFEKPTYFDFFNYYGYQSVTHDSKALWKLIARWQEGQLLL